MGDRPAMIRTPYDAYLLAATLWGEARGEGEAGMFAVGWVVKNRLLAHGRAIPEVLLDPGDFSCWERPAHCLLAPLRDPVGFSGAMRVADTLLYSGAPDPTGGATHYVNLALAHPPWYDPAKVTVVIGRHTFLKGVA